MKFLRSHRRAFVLLVLAVMVSLAEFSANAVFGQRNFVTSITPIIGPRGGVVGGISIDPEGVVNRADADAVGQLSRARAKAIGVVSATACKSSPLRKISLRMLEQELIRLRDANLPLPGEVEFLAGLQRVEYVFLDHERNDIVLAGPAEGWRVEKNGFVVGESSGLPVIELCDLLVALRADRNQAFQGITCSMDATPEGLQRYSSLMRGGKREMSEQMLDRMRNAIGNFQVTFTGIRTDSHYARVLIAADLMMKRLGMNLETSPVPEVKSYVQLLQKSKQKISVNKSPRWWLASDYEPVLCDEERSAWKIRGKAIKAMTGEDFLSSNGQKIAIQQRNHLAQKWADDFTRHYPELSVAMPVFGQLRNCMDLAVLSALLTKHNLWSRAQLEGEILRSADQIRLVEFAVPQFTPPQISYAKGRKGWIVTLSGGVDLNGWSVASNLQTDTDLNAIQNNAITRTTDHWWWD